MWLPCSCLTLRVFNNCLWLYEYARNFLCIISICPRYLAQLSRYARTSAVAGFIRTCRHYCAESSWESRLGASSDLSINTFTLGRCYTWANNLNERNYANIWLLDLVRTYRNFMAFVWMDHTNFGPIYRAKKPQANSRHVMVITDIFLPAIWDYLIYRFGKSKTAKS